MSEIINKIKSKKKQIARELYDWAETFEHEVDEDDEITTEAYDFVFDLGTRLENDECSKQDYVEILFHIWQINYNEIKIRL
jgi:siderophore synthetase component